MKTKALKSIIVAMSTLLFVLPVLSQKGIEDGSKYGHGQDSINCLMNLSLYKEFFRHNNYKDAINPWRKVFGECPAASENMFIDGTTMYKKFIQDEKNEARQNQLIDTLMLIYDRRSEYFPKREGSNLGRKAIDLLRFKRNDIDAVTMAYGDLKKSIEMEKLESRDAVFVTFISASITLNKAGKINDGQSIEDYFMVTEMVDKLLKQSKKWVEAKAGIDENMLSSGLLTCDALNKYFEPQYAANQGNKEFLQKVIKFYTATNCDRSDLYVNASERMYAIEPGPESAHNLATLFIKKSEYDKASKYLKEAVAGENIDNATKADWYYEMAVVSAASKDYCESINAARQAVSLNSEMGKAYMIMGDAIVGARTSLGDDFEQATAFWVAIDKYSKAKSVDPTQAEDANQKIREYSNHFPNNEEVFFRDLSDGDSYQVKGCINEYTTVRARQ
ncbi:MAG: hypothetical protein R2751_14480 [Bacteroidales bacterium]